MIVHEPETEFVDGRALVSARIELSRRAQNPPERLWFSLREQDAGFVDDRSNAFAAALLPVAMASGEDLEIRGHLCPRLAFGLEEYQRLLHTWRPKQLKQVSIRCNDLQPQTDVQPTGVGAAFSGGVDSFFSLKSHLGENEPKPSFRISHGLFVHGFDIALEQASSYQEAANAYDTFLRSVGVHLICVRTNLREFTKSPGWEMSHGAALIGTALLLGRLLCRFYVPSSRSYETLIPWGSHPLLDPLLSTDTLQVIHDAAHLTRVDKIRVLAAWSPTYSLLRTCYVKTDGLKNCCRCDNCVRTMTAFAVCGSLHKYSTFQLPLERRHIRRGLVLTRHERACADQVIKLARANHRDTLVFDQRCALLSSPFLAVVRYGKRALTVAVRLAANRWFQLARQQVRRVFGVHWFEIWERSLEEPFEHVHAPPGVKFRFARPEDLPRFAGIVRPEMVEEFEHRLAQGLECLIGLLGERLVYYGWLSINSQYPAVLNRAFHPGSDYAYLFNSHTVPELRGQHVGSAASILRSERARALGCRRALVWVELRNEANRKILMRTGFKPRRKALRITVLEWRWFHCWTPRAAGSWSLR